MASRKKSKKLAQTRKPRESSEGNELQGWAQIGSFLGQPLAVAQRWAHSGMPISRKGRYVTASKQELSSWLGRESGVRAPVHIAIDSSDLTTDLKRGLTYVRSNSKKGR
jgi:hypothetical protein